MLQFGVNKTTGSGLFNGIDIWSVIPADVKAHIARVTADGGTVPNQASMVSSVKKLIAANLWNNCVFFGLPLGGVKKDGNQYVSKVYDLKANADLTQAIGTEQPKYNTDGSLLYDGNDQLLSLSLGVSSSIRNTVNNFTVCTTVVRGAFTDSRFLFSRDRATAGNRVFYISFSSAITGQWYTPSSIVFGIFATDGNTANRVKSSNISTINGGKYNVISSWDGSEIYLSVNGDESGSYNPSFNGSGNVANIECPIAISGLSSGAGSYRVVGGIGVSMMFNKILSTSEKIIVNEILSDWS